MARRILSQSFLKSPAFFSVPRRLRSSRSGTAIVIDLDSSAPSTSSSVNEEFDRLRVMRIEEALQTFIVMQSTPDWLPFVPGKSFWVPSMNMNHSGNVGELVGKIGSSLSQDAANKTSLSDEETLSLSSSRGSWPRRDYFTKEGATPTPMITIGSSRSEDVTKNPAVSDAEMLARNSRRGCWPHRNFFTQEEDASVELEEDAKVAKEENSKSENTEG